MLHLVADASLWWFQTTAILSVASHCCYQRSIALAVHSLGFCVLLSYIDSGFVVEHPLDALIVGHGHLVEFHCDLGFAGGFVVRLDWVILEFRQRMFGDKRTVLISLGSLDSTAVGPWFGGLFNLDKQNYFLEISLFQSRFSLNLVLLFRFFLLDFHAFGGIFTPLTDNFEFHHFGSAHRWAPPDQVTLEIEASLWYLLRWNWLSPIWTSLRADWELQFCSIWPSCRRFRVGMRWKSCQVYRMSRFDSTTAWCTNFYFFSRPSSDWPGTKFCSIAQLVGEHACPDQTMGFGSAIQLPAYRGQTLHRASSPYRYCWYLCSSLILSRLFMTWCLISQQRFPSNNSRPTTEICSLLSLDFLESSIVIVPRILHDWCVAIRKSCCSSIASLLHSVP